MKTQTVRSQPRSRIWIPAVLIFGGVLMLLPQVSKANLGVDQVTNARCTEESSAAVPKKLTIYQIVNDSVVAAASQPAIGFFASYLFRFDVDSGRVIAQGTVLKQDGSKISLPKLSGKMKFGDAEKIKDTTADFEVGDIIEWKVKFKNLPRLRAGLDCLSIDLSIGGSDSVVAMSGLRSRKQVARGPRD